MDQKMGKLLLSEEGLRVSYVKNNGETRKPLVALAQLFGSLFGKSRESLVGTEVEFFLNNNKVVAAWEAGGDPPSAQELKARREASSFKPPDPRVSPDRFLNPYAYVWTPDREQIGRLQADRPGRALGDAAPPSRARWQPGLWSGRIAVTLTTKSPLLVFEDAPREVQGEHHTYGVLKDDQNRPLLPGSIVKGLLRSDYEAVTNSRFGVFKGHEARRGRRMESAESQGLVPARVTADGRELDLFDGGSTGHWPGHGPIQIAGWIGYYNRLKKLPGVPAHGDRLIATLLLFQHSRNGKPTFRYWKVWKWVKVQGEGEESLERARSSLATAKEGFSRELGRGNHTCLGSEITGVGFVVVSGPNTPRKHDERFFFNARATPIAIGEAGKYWVDVLRSYGEEHEGEDCDRLREDGTALSKHLRELPGQLSELVRTERPLGGTLCYAQLSGGSIKALYPVPISRALYDKPPVDLLPRSLHPAEQLSSLSPADRVFGWVGRGGGAFRGGLRIHTVSRPHADSVKPLNPPIPLQILGTPKRYGRFALVAISPGGEPTHLDGAPARKEFYTTTQRLAGRKFYWTHAGLSDGYWHDGAASGPPAADGSGRYQEYRHPATDEAARTRFNRSVSEWIEPATEFMIEFDVFNLSSVELGGLLWYLKSGMVRNTGYARPLGFGAVQWALHLPGCSLLNGSEIVRSYDDPRGIAPVHARHEDTETRVNEMVEAFVEATKDAWGVSAVGDAPHIKDLLAVSRGRREFAVHYPRMGSQPDPNGENYKWFVENERSPRHAPGRPGETDPWLPLSP